jgi:hypothetical protein
MSEPTSKRRASPPLNRSANTAYPQIKSAPGMLSYRHTWPGNCPAITFMVSACRRPELRHGLPRVQMRIRLVYSTTSAATEHVQLLPPHPVPAHLQRGRAGPAPAGAATSTLPRGPVRPGAPAPPDAGLYAQLAAWLGRQPQPRAPLQACITLSIRKMTDSK